jgi:hypothetical protein
MMEPTREQIAARAYQLYLERGCRNGHDMDDWLQAEYDLRQLPLQKLAEITPPVSRRAKSNGKPAGKSLVEVVHMAALGLGF